MRTSFAAGVLALAMTATSAFGGYVITQTAAPDSPPLSGPYITFDEPNVPTGDVGDPFTFYQASDDLVFGSFEGGIEPYGIDAFPAETGGGSGNQIMGFFRLRMTFTKPVDAVTFQGWASGSPSFPFGGINVFVGSNRTSDFDPFVAQYTGVAPFGGVGNEWFNVRADGGDTFDEIIFFNGAFNSFSQFIDNVNYRIVPEPHALGLGMLASLAGLAFRRRR